MIQLIQNHILYYRGGGGRIAVIEIITWCIEPVYVNSSNGDMSVLSPWCCDVMLLFIRLSETQHGLTWLTLTGKMLLNFQTLLCLKDWPKISSSISWNRYKALCIHSAAHGLPRGKKRDVLNLCLLIHQLPGRKDLFIDADLMSPLDRIANVTTLKVRNV